MKLNLELDHLPTAEYYREADLTRQRGAHRCEARCGKNPEEFGAIVAESVGTWGAVWTGHQAKRKLTGGKDIDQGRPDP